MMYLQPTLLMLLLVAATVKSEVGTFDVLNNWNTAYSAKASVLLTENVGPEGWIVTLKFSKPVQRVDQWTGDVISSDGQTFKIENKYYNAKQSAGTNFEIAMNVVKGTFDEDPADATVTFRAKNSGGGEETTNPPVTTNPPTPPTGSTPGTFTITSYSSWKEGFDAEVTFPIGQDKDGWEVIITFSHSIDVLYAWNGDVTPENGRTYKIRNKSWNRQLSKCDTFVLELQGKKSPKISNPSAVAFINVGPGDDSCSVPSTPPTNPPVVTSAPPEPTSGSTTAEPPPTSTNAPATTAAPVPSTNAPVTSAPNPSTSAPSTPSPDECTDEPGPSTTQSPPSTTQPPVVTQSPPSTTTQPQSGTYKYNEVLHKSILFYEAQRSGKLPAKNRVPWRKDSALNDRGNNGEDLIGGWYDAGDYVKFGFPMASSATVLAWGLVEYRDAYQSAGELSNMLDSLKWATDYFIKAHTGKYEFYGQVGNGGLDHAYWGRPEDMTMARPAYKITQAQPGSDLAAETAAALAAASIAFKATDSGYAQTLIGHARELYQFADLYRGKYSDSITDAAKYYKSHNGFEDELVWGAVWLYRATEEESYLIKAEQYYSQFGMNSKPWSFSWDEKTPGVQLILAKVATNKTPYKQHVQTFLDSWLPGGDVPYTPKGLAWRAKWSPNRYSANVAFLALVAADMGLEPSRYREFARKQIHYMLGDAGRSYVVGFGTNPPQRPHHASSSCPLAPSPCSWNEFHNPGPNPQVLQGALVGGPDQNDHYEDKRNDYIMNEVTTDYNAGFQSAVAGLIHLQPGK